MLSSGSGAITGFSVNASSGHHRDRWGLRLATGYAGLIAVFVRGGPSMGDGPTHDPLARRRTMREP